jgi:hypothetical protein
MIHHNFEDPAALQGSEEKRLTLFRRVRDEIRQYLMTFPPCPRGVLLICGSTLHPAPRAHAGITRTSWLWPISLAEHTLGSTDFFL